MVPLLPANVPHTVPAHSLRASTCSLDQSESSFHKAMLQMNSPSLHTYSCANLTIILSFIFF